MFVWLMNKESINLKESKKEVFGSKKGEFGGKNREHIITDYNLK